MQLRIVHKLFFAFIVVAALNLIALGGLAHWNFTRGFLHYVNEHEEKSIDAFANHVSSVYQINHSWDSLRGDSMMSALNSKADILAHHLPSPPPMPSPESGTFLTPPSPRHFKILQMHSIHRKAIYDKNKEIVAGSIPFAEMTFTKAIMVDDATVGWIGVKRLEKFESARDIKFVKRQAQTLLQVIAVLSLMAAIAAMVIARRLVKPIHALAAGAKALASGDFNQRIERTSRDELGSLTDDFNHLAKTLQERKSARRRWLADISHELRTPLSILRGEIEAVQDGIRDPNDERFQSITTEVMALNKLVDDLYQLSLSDLGALEYQFEPCVLTTIVEEVLEQFQARFAEAEIALLLQLTPDVQISGDRQRLNQLLTNLLENTLRYTNAPGRCNIELSIAGDQACLNISDSHPGVNEATFDKLFDHLYRADESRSRQHGGSGLGLAICKKIAEAHRASIVARKSTLGGVTIEIKFPLET